MVIPRLLCLAALFGVFISEAQSANPLQPADAVGKIGSKLKPDRTLIYKEIGDRKLRLDLFEPKGIQRTDRRVCFVAIHGGGWTSGNPAWMYPFLTDLVELGMVGISVEYRLRSDSSTVFDCVKDARSAIRYVRAHAAELGIDPNKIVVCGSSAGGLLATDLLFPNSPAIDDAGDDLSVSCAPQALVLHYPPVDTSKLDPKFGTNLEPLSPLPHMRAGLPPTLIFQGTGDKLVPFQSAQAYCDAMKKAGNRCELVLNAGGGHGYMRKDLKLYEEVRARTREFLVSLGWLPREPDGKITPPINN